MQAQAKCKDRVREHLTGRLSDLRQLIEAERAGNEEGVEGIGTLNEYGLSLDYVAPGTFTGQRRGYWRYQLSWGGPSDEFRFYGDLAGEYSAVLEKVEYWFMDWYDGARITMRSGPRFNLLSDLFSDWSDCGTLAHLHAKAMEDAA